MKKLINKVDDVLTESLRGFVAAHGDIVSMGDEGKYVIRKNLKQGKVALISGGGSGHEPLHAGLVGHGMLDAACPGQVFTSPTPDQMMAAAEAADTGAGVLFIVKNYEGDLMNFDMAREMCGKTVETVITNEDVAVENSLYTTGRRGVAGTLVVEKIVGSAAEKGADLASLKALGDRTNAATRSMGVALTSCTVPAAGKPTFDIGADEMEMGVGIHGEPGRRRVKLKSAHEIARRWSRPSWVILRAAAMRSSSSTASAARLPWSSISSMTAPAPSWKSAASASPARSSAIMSRRSTWPVAP